MRAFGLKPDYKIPAVCVWVTLLVDEVNIALKTEPETDEDILRETREALQYFTLFSREETKVCPEARRHGSSARLSLDADV
jgi:hypothetical protein